MEIFVFGFFLSVEIIWCSLLCCKAFLSAAVVDVGELVLGWTFFRS